jgi:hypothetical protein
MAHVLGFDDSLDLPVKMRLSDGVTSRGIEDVAEFKHAHLVPFAKPALRYHVLLASKPVIGSTTLQDSQLQSERDMDAAISQGAYCMDHLFDESMPTWLFESLLQNRDTLIEKAISKVVWHHKEADRKHPNMIYWHNVGIGQYASNQNGRIGLVKNKLDQIMGHLITDGIPNRASFGTYQRGQPYQAQNVCHDHQQFGFSHITLPQIKDALHDKGIVYLGSHSERDLRVQLYDEQSIKGFIQPSIFVSVYNRPASYQSPAVLHRFSPLHPEQNIGQLMNDTLRNLHGVESLADSKELMQQATQFYKNLDLN